jgi:hypothetical protein
MRSLKRIGTGILLLFLATSFPSSRLVAAPAPGDIADFFVSPVGDDGNPGSAQQPFLTLEQARHAVQVLKQKEPDRDFVVRIRGGTHVLRQTVVFTVEDSAPAGHTITYAAYAGERPVFTSGLSLKGWRQVRTGVPGQTPAAGGKLWAASVPAELKDVSMLFDGEGRLPRARSRGFMALPAAACRDRSAYASHMHVAPGTIPPWSVGDNWELAVVPMHPFTFNILPVTRVSEDGQIICSDVPSTYPLTRSRLRSDEGSAWIENAIEVLDEPGEWVFDAEARTVYLWPRGDRPSDSIVTPRLSEYIRVQGQAVEAGAGDVAVRGLVFRGLTFTQGDRLKWQPDKTGRGLQHDWEMFDRPTALLRMRCAQECVVEGCRFTDSGGAGIRLDLYAQRNTIRGNLVARLGGVGILLAGYGPGVKDVNRDNEVSENHVHHIGETLWQSPAIFAWQSGRNRIAGNLVHHCPYTAIVVSGRIIWDRTGQGECSRTIRWDEIEEALRGGPQPPWSKREKYLHARGNIVEANEIHDVMQRIDDGNCIYVSGAGGQNVVSGNYLHDVPSPHMNAAIRCDDDQHGTTIVGNIVWRTCGEGFINKGDNTFTDNIVADLRACSEEQLKSARGFMVMPYGDVKGATIQRNIFYCTQSGMKLMSEDAAKMKGFPPALLRLCRADRNVYFSTKDPRWASAHLKTQCGYGVECNSIEADPRFVDIDHGNFRLMPDSPALRLGFQAGAARPVGRDRFPFNE